MEQGFTLLIGLQGKQWSMKYGTGLHPSHRPTRKTMEHEIWNRAIPFSKAYKENNGA
ncbi:hypothetical protein DPMN_146451 [Dreissena polymorpha]|uniref:Uncharacterized protein n=1 Tax=Dreissena polymorpha TaxID=45954 RepID=A0A9D4J200_DREPO|nr:hypothetical protein DPMN_146451 [Dreissena polymorpha]